MLAGVLCGIPIVPAYTKAAILILAVVSVLWAVNKSRDLGKGTLLFLCTCAVIFFLAGFFRGKSSGRRYEDAERKPFYEKYEATNPGEFDYALYLKGMGVTCEEERESMGEPPAALKAARTYLEGVLDRCLPEHDAGIYKAMLLGDKTQMDGQVKDLYQTSGIAHLLAVSGLHVSLIGMGLYRLLRKKIRLSEELSLAAASLCTFLYVCLTGASASAVRAGIMLFVNLSARKAGRSYDLLTALSLSFLVLLWKEPYTVFLSGFQLSFGAMAGIFLGNEVTRSLYRCGTLEKRSGLLSSFLSSLWVTIVTLPVTVSNYYFFPPYSVLLNLAVIPLMTVVMVSGLCVLALGIPGLWSLSSAAAAPGHYVLKFYEWICGKVSSLPFSKIVTGKPGPAGILFYYVILAVCFVFLTTELSVRKDKDRESRRRQRKRNGCRIALTAASLGAVVFLRYREPDHAYVEVLDVGQGDCFHIHEEGTDILIDGGSSGYDKVGENVIEPYLLSRGIRKLDAVIVSHADSDHINGIEYLLQEGKADVGILLLPAMGETDEKYDRLKTGKCREIRYLKAGDRFRAGSASLTCLYSGESKEARSDTNRQSSVVLYERGDFSMLFTGDMTKEDELLLMASAYGGMAENVDVLKVAHHGSKTASGEAFLNKATPTYAVLSYRKNNRFGHPHEETLKALSGAGVRMLKTPETGAMKICVKEDGYVIESFRNGIQSMKTK